MSDPSQSYSKQATRMLRFLKGTADTVPIYGAAPSSKLVGWSDSDYASDIGERRSRTRYMFKLNGELEESAATDCGAVDSGGRVYGADCGHS
jgi:hypothetical protein